MPKGGESIALGVHTNSMRTVSVWLVNILPQMRKSFDPTELGELSESVAAKGMIHAPTVSLFTEGETRQYLCVINKLWGSSISIDQLLPSVIGGRRFWYILLAGERRTRSYRGLVKARLKPRMYKVVVHEHIDPLDAIDIQFSENCHRRVPPHEEAHAYAEFWALLEAHGHILTVANFSRRVGRSSQAVKAAMLFVSLPQVIRNAVAGEWGTAVEGAELFRKAKLKLSYGIAVELARLREASTDTSDKELLNLMTEAIVSDTKVEDFKIRINAILESDGQSMFDLLSLGAEADARKIFRRRTVEADVLRTLHGYEAWFARVLTLYSTGQLGREDSPFALSSVRKRLQTVGELYAKVFEVAYKRPPSSTHRRHAHVQELTRTVRGLNEQLQL